MHTLLTHPAVSWPLFPTVLPPIGFPSLILHLPHTHPSLTPHSGTKHAPQSPSQLTLLLFPELILMRPFIQLAIKLD